MALPGLAGQATAGARLERAGWSTRQPLSDVVLGSAGRRARRPTPTTVASPRARAGVGGRRP